MAAQVEARSLSDLNFLATNPPQYPVNPTETHRESLILYISRVPGTRDIILSTYKPQRKNVTVTDVANSLYYVHLDSPSDEILAAAAARQALEGRSPRSSIESARGPILRKPLPSVPSATEPSLPPRLPVSASPGPAATMPSLPSVPISLRPGPATAGPRGFESQEPRGPSVPKPETKVPMLESVQDDFTVNPMFRTNRRSRTPVEDYPELSPRPQKQSPPAGSPISRKPLGPRPQPVQLPVEDELSVSAASASRAVHGAHSPHASHDSGYGQPFPQSRSGSPTTSSHRATFAPFSLTIIRRDPASGHQWNIGKTSSFQTNIPTPDQAGPNLNPHDLGVPRGTYSIDINLETSGYAKYRGMPTRESVDVARRPQSSSSSSPTAIHGRPSVDERYIQTATRPSNEGEGFSRQVLMAYSQSWTSNFKRAFRRRESSTNSASYSPEDLAPPRPQHVRNNSANSTGSADSAASREEKDGRDSPPLITQPGPGLKPRGYVFMSPWQGRCEFRTGNGGRSLKCRHKLQPNSGGFNPLVLGQSVRDGQAFSRSRNASVSDVVTGSKPVSELRYNLPSSDVFGSSKKGDGHRNFQDQFSKLLKLEEPSSDEDEDMPMDLSLGREKAGGGNRGKRAKLGKLIIHDEGLKMLDLVVAANVGVWWMTWERTF